MRLVVTADLMRGFDRAAIAKAGIPGLLLMENAGRGFVDALAQRIGVLEGRSVAVICGKGNNGGDGFVIGRHLANRGCEVIAFLMGKARELKGDARSNFLTARAISKIRGSRLRVVEAASLAALKPGRDAAVVVDALLGTGFSGEPRGLVADAIRWINAREAFVAAVDIPSGIDASTGMSHGHSVKAHLTVTMGLMKVGHLVGQGADKSGEVIIADIGIPPGLMQPTSEPIVLVAPEDLHEIMPVRPKNAHKYSVGKVLVIGGSRNFVGAPIMTATAALKAGAGAVVLAVPRSLYGALSRRLTEVILLPLDETSDGGLSLASLPRLRERLGWADAVAIGPGLGRNPESLSVVRTVLGEFSGCAVVDADGIAALKGHVTLVKQRAGRTVITPHAGEFGSLFNVPSQKVDGERVARSLAAARTLKAIVVLKGAPTVTAAPNGSRWINPTGNPGMATIGSGDVLTGVIAGLAAQGCAPEAAAWSGVYLHGLAGDRAVRQRGEQGMMATDLLEEIPAAIMQALPATRR